MTDIKPNVPKIIIPSNPSNDMEEDNSTSSSLSEMKETEYPHSSSSSLSISFEDKKDANNNIGKTTPREKKKEALPEQQDNEKKKEKRSKRGSFKRIREEGEGLVKSFSGIFSGKEKTKKQESNDSVPPSPRTKYHKSSSSSSSSEARQKRRNNNVSSSSSDTNNNYPQSDDDNLRTRAKKTRNRLSIVNLSDLIKSSDDKKEKENRRRTFHFTTGQFDNIDFSDPKNSFVNNNNNNNNNNEANTVKNKRGILISTIKYDSPISGKFIANSAPVSPTTFGKEDDNDNNNNNLISSIQKLAIEEEEEDEKQIEIDLPETKERELNETTTATSQTTAITSSTTTTTTTAVSLNEKNEGIKEDCAANNNNDDDDGDDDVEQKFGRDISNDTEIFDGIGSDRTRNITTTTTIANNNASNILLEPSSLNSILSNNVAKTSSSSTNNSHTLGDIKGSEELKTIYKVPKFSTNINKVGVNIDDDKNEEDLTIVMTGEASNNNKIGNFATKNENKVEDNPNKISMLESIVLRQLDLAEKMQETMSRLESKVSGQMEDTIRKLEDKINEQNVELDDLKTIVGKLQENQQMMIANEAYHNQDLQAIHRELALVSQTSSTSFSHLQQQVYTRNTLVDTLVVRPLYNTITVSASIATSVMYTVYVRPVVSLVRVVRQGL